MRENLTSGVRREALRRIPGAAGRNLEERSWVNWLTWTRKREGTRACQMKQQPTRGVHGVVLRDPRDMAKAGLLVAQSPAVKVTHPSE